MYIDTEKQGSAASLLLLSQTKSKTFYFLLFLHNNGRLTPIFLRQGGWLNFWPHFFHAFYFANLHQSVVKNWQVFCCLSKECLIHYCTDKMYVISRTNYPTESLDTLISLFMQLCVCVCICGMYSLKVILKSRLFYVL